MDFNAVIGTARQITCLMWLYSLKKQCENILTINDCQNIERVKTLKNVLKMAKIKVFTASFNLIFFNTIVTKKLTIYFFLNRRVGVSPIQILQDRW